MNLTEPESLAKEHFINLVLKGRGVPIDAADGSSFSFNKPLWFDAEKFELGRQYFMENRAGILMTNLAGLILLLAIPKGLAILRGTDRSHTPDLARDRYIDTILHTISWYNYQLDNSTRSWDSLRTVRQMHMYASYSSAKRNLGFISQMEVSMTTFGFAGFVLNRPHLFAIKANDPKKRKGFLHFWAVLNYMLGVHDEFNICLLPLKAAKIEFDIIMRNVFGPYLQVETVLFKEMVTALIEGLRDFLPLLDYESQLFLTRRAAGIPGYQFNVNLDKEKPYRNIFSQEDLIRINQPIISDKIVILNVDTRPETIDNNSLISNPEMVSSKPIDYSYEFFDYNKLAQLLALPDPDRLNVTEVARDDLPSYFNDHQYNRLNMLSKIYVNTNLIFIETLGSNGMGKIILEEIISQQFTSMRNYRKKRRYPQQKK